MFIRDRCVERFGNCWIYFRTLALKEEVSLEFGFFNFTEIVRGLLFTSILRWNSSFRDHGFMLFTHVALRVFFSLSKDHATAECTFT